MRIYNPKDSLIVIVFVVLMSSLHADILNGYSNYKSLTKQLQAIEKEFPDIVKLTSLGKTIQKRDLQLIALGAQSEQEKPAIAMKLMRLSQVKSVFTSSAQPQKRTAKSTASHRCWIDILFIYCRASAPMPQSNCGREFRTSAC